MKKKVILPVKYPIVTTSPDSTNYLSIIGTVPEADDWLYSNLIQLGCRNDMSVNNNSVFFACGTELMGRPYLTCPWIRSYYVNSSFISNSGNIALFLRRCIDSGYYVSIDVNQRYLKCSPCHGLYDHIHTIFVYGYDRTKDLFYIADFFNNSKYSFETASSFEIEDCYNKVGHPVGIILFYLLAEKSSDFQLDYSLNIKRICNSLAEYLCIGDHNIISCDKDKYLYGIQVYGELDRLIENACEGKVILNKKSFHIVYQHKLLMTKRIDYLNSRRILTHYTDIKNSAAETEHDAQMVLNMAIKSIIKQDPNAAAKSLHDKLAHMMNLEIECYSQLKADLYEHL